MANTPATTIQEDATTGAAGASRPVESHASLPAARWASTLRRNRFVDMIIIALLVVIAFTSYVSGIDSTAFHQDESRWLNRAHYLTDLADPFGPTWNDQYLTRGQPPVGSYMMGLGLMVQGRDLETNNAYDFRRSREFNEAIGAIPDRDDLLAGRRWNSLLGAIAVGAVYLIVRQLTNPVGGLVGALFLIGNPLQIWHNRLALADTTLTLTLALLMLCVIQLMRKPAWGWAIAAGILIGIGGANKFTPIALVAPLAAIGAIQLILGWRDNRRLKTPASSGSRGVPSLRNPGWMLLSTPFTALATFVLVYPYLWPNPIGRTLELIRFRQDEMANQYRIYPQFRTDTPLDAIDRTLVALGDAWSSTGHMLSSAGFETLAERLSMTDVVLAVAGLLAITVVGVIKGIRSAELAVAALVVFQTGTIILSMRVDFERYYLPILLGEVVAIGCCIGYLAWGARMMFTRMSPDQNQRAPLPTPGR